jgi:phosphopantetheinyl transferase (holo-ACP synthase)
MTEDNNTPLSEAVEVFLNAYRARYMTTNGVRSNAPMRDEARALSAVFHDRAHPPASSVKEPGDEITDDMLRAFYEAQCPPGDSPAGGLTRWAPWEEARINRAPEIRKCLAAMWAVKPANPSPTIEGLREALTVMDAKIKECPSGRPNFDRNKPCPKCRAKMSDNCGLEVTAEFAFIQFARQALSMTEEGR